MSVVLELEAGRRKTGRVCDRSYRNGTGCPLIVRTTSEDVMTATAFGLLRYLRPSLWLAPMLRAACPGIRFSTRAMGVATLSFWEEVPAPPVRPHREGATEVDVLVRWGHLAVLIEVKFLAQVANRTRHDLHRDQLIRLMDVGFARFRDQTMSPLEPLVILLGVPRTEPALLTRYRQPAAVREALSEYDRFPDTDRIGEFLARRIGYISWSYFARMLTHAIPAAGRLEQRLLADVARYIRQRVSAADERQSMRRQVSLPLMGPSVVDEGELDEP